MSVGIGATVLALACGSTATAELVGRINGGFDTTASGAASYAIPIDVPAGINGLRPELALVYNSQLGDGDAGNGWTLTGFSEIARCGQTLALDRQVRGVRFDALDRYCLDGQPLLLVSGVHGAAGAEYRTELHDFERVLAHGRQGSAPAWFEVIHADGARHRYGNDADSRIEAPGTGNEIRIWALNEIVDKFQQRVGFAYAEDTANGEFHPAEIRWSHGSGEAHQAPYRLSLIWESRPPSEVRSGFLWGSPWKRSQRLVAIDYEFNGGEGFARVHRYALSHTQPAAPARSRLASITQCGPTECLPATVLAWDESSELRSINAYAGPPVLKSVVGDFNGDGAADIFGNERGRWAVWPGNPQGRFRAPIPIGGTFTSSSVARPLDFNGDGLTDLMTGSALAPTWLVYLAPKPPATSFQVKNTGLRWSADAEVLPLDIDADGDDDFVYLRDAEVYVRRNNDGVLAAEQRGGSSEPLPGHLRHTGTKGYLEPADFDGDGRRDLLVMRSTVSGSQSVWEAFLSTGGGFASEPLGTVLTRLGRDALLVLDINGDGLSDILRNERAGGTWHSLLSRGGRGGTDSGFDELTCSPQLNLASATPAAFDIDGDGRAELLAKTGGATFIFRSEGSCFGAAGTTARFTDPYEDRRVAIADADGDGNSDVLFGSSKRDEWSVSKPTPWLRPDGTTRAHKPGLLREVTDGLSNSLEIFYRPLSGWTGYRADGNEVAATRLLRGGPLTVVSEYRADAGNGSRFGVTVSYANARSDALGRGYFGFSAIRRTDSRNGLIAETSYRQDFPFAGRPSRVTIWNGSNRVTDSEMTWGAHTSAVPDVARSVHFVHLSGDTSDAYEVDREGGLDGSLVHRTIRTLTWSPLHGAVTNEQVTVSSPLHPGVLHRSVRATTLDDALRTSAGCLAQPLRVEVSRELPGAAPITRAVEHTYDATTCRPVSNVEGSFSDLSQQLRTSYEYDALGRVLSVTRTDGAGRMRPRRTRFAYGSTSDRPVSEAASIDAEADLVVTQVWNERLGLAAARTNAQGLTTTWRHDELGRPADEIRAAGRTQTRYSACGPCFAPTARYAVRHTRSDGHWSETQHDSLGRTVGRAFALIGSDVSRQLVDYDEFGRVLRESTPHRGDAQPLHWTRYGYDLSGRPKRVDRPSAADTPSGVASSTIAYSGTSFTTRDGEGRTTTYVQDAEGRLLSVQAPLGGGASYAYDAFGQLTTITDGAGHQRQLSYDGRGLLAATVDPDAGQRSFGYNAFGERIRQADGQSTPNVVAFRYDQLGRMISRTEPEGVTAWRYGAAPGPARGLLEQVTGPPEVGSAGFRESYGYDVLGRLSNTTTVIDGIAYRTDYSFDNEGKLTALTYPDTVGWRPRFLFDYSNGHLTGISQDGLTIAPVYALVELDARARERSARFGSNALEEHNVYDEASGRLIAIRAGTASRPDAVQSYTYEWDQTGNLWSRRDLTRSPAVEERFYYDMLSRLGRVTLNGVDTLSMRYAADGNLLHKSDVGQLTYGASGRLPHAVTSVGGGPRGALAFTYDANGNMATRDGASLQWTSFNLPRRIDAGADYSRFSYGPDRARVRQEIKFGAVTKTVHYVGPHFEVETTGGTRRYRATVFAHGRAVYSQIETTPSGLEAYYVLHDHAGSVDKLVRAVGAGSDALAHSFDAWGKRRNHDWSADALDRRATDAQWLERGFTGHEHLDNLRLIHMGGRLQDPVLGRMLAPDPVLGSLLSPQTLNPYSYAANNPTSYVDPSGFFLRGIRDFLKRGIRHFGAFLERVVNRWGRQIAAVAAGWMASGAVSSWASSTQISPISVTLGAAPLGNAAAGTLTATLPAGVVLGGMAGGAVAGAVSSGTVKGAAVGVTVGGITAGFGGYYGGSQSLGRIVNEATVGGAASAVQGGGFGGGFVASAGLSSLTWASIEMRRAMIEQSRIRYDMAEPLYARDNAQGVSEGMRGDFFKLGGCRIPCKGSPLGGLQGGPGNVFSMRYGPGSFLDRLVETYSGPHDFLNSPLFYDAYGNNVPRPGIAEVINATNVLVATPFAAASTVPAFAYGALGD